MTSESKTSSTTPCIFYVVLAFGLALALLPFRYFVGEDGAYYARVSQNLLAGNGICANPGEFYPIHPPIYPLLIGLLNLVLKNVELSGHLVALLAFSLSLLPIYALARRIYPCLTAHWASLLYLTNGFLLVHTIEGLMAESLFTFLVLIEFYWVHCILQGEKKRMSAGMVVGLVSGLAVLTRPEGLFFLLAGLMAILLLSPESLGIRIRFTLLALGVFLVLLILYLLLMHRETGKWQLSQGVTEILIKRQMAVSPVTNDLEAKKIYEGLTADKTRLKMEELVENFGLFDTLTKDNFALLRSWLPSLQNRMLELDKYLFGWLGYLLIGAALFSSPWNPKRAKSEALFFIYLLTFLPQGLGTPLSKRFFHYFPILLLWMGHGLEILRTWAQGTFRLTQTQSRWLAVSVSSFFIFLSARYLLVTFLNAPLPMENKTMGIWMKENIPDINEQRVASRHPSVNFYSGSKILKLPYVDDLNDLVTFLRHQRAKYFVVSENLDYPYSEAYRPLLVETGASLEGVTRRHVLEGRKKYFLYEVELQ